jgi:hypothetical protein
VPAVTIEVESPNGSSADWAGEVNVPAISSVAGKIRANPHASKKIARQALILMALGMRLSDYFRRDLVSPSPASSEIVFRPR